MSHYGIRSLVTQLVDNSPGKAVDILTRCCEDSKILEEVTSHLLLPRSRQYEASAPTPPANRLDITFAPPVSPSSHGSHHAGTPPPRQRPPRRLSSTTYPLSPPGTASSVTSHSTRDGSGSGEYILLPTRVGDKVVELTVRMKSAPIKYSVIRDDVVGRRNLEDSFPLSPAEVTDVEVPHRASGGVQLVQVSWSIDLTWRRPHSDSTHGTIFYLVPREVLDVDMCLGCDDSGPEFTPTIIPQPQARQPPAFQNYKQELRLHAPTPPSASYHRSARTHNESSRASPILRHDGQHHSYHMVEPFLSRQQSYETAIGDHQPSPANTVLGSRIEHPQPLRTNSVATTPVRDADPNKASDRIRMSLLWGATTLNVWLDLSAHGEAFYRSFQQQAVKQRKTILDRAMMTIKLKNDKNTSDEESYSLSLDEEELEADWETTREWLDENRRDKSPHIYGVMDMGEG